MSGDPDVKVPDISAMDLMEDIDRAMEVIALAKELPNINFGDGYDEEYP